MNIHLPACLIYWPGWHLECSTANSQEPLFCLMQWKPSCGSQSVSSVRMQDFWIFSPLTVDTKTQHHFENLNALHNFLFTLIGLYCKLILLSLTHTCSTHCTGETLGEPVGFMCESWCKTWNTSCTCIYCAMPINTVSWTNKQTKKIFFEESVFSPYTLSWKLFLVMCGSHELSADLTVLLISQLWPSAVLQSFDPIETLTTSSLVCLIRFWQDYAGLWLSSTS